MDPIILLIIVSFLIILEGLFISVFPKKTKRMIISMSRNLKQLRIVGIIEAIIGILLLLIVFL